MPMAPPNTTRRGDSTGALRLWTRSRVQCARGSSACGRTHPPPPLLTTACSALHVTAVTQEGLTLASTTCIVASGGALLVGWYFIRWGRSMPRHRAAMLAATAFAGLFLVTYVTRWSLYGSKHFTGTGIWRTIFFANLVPH